jgi:hypothetical protein
LTKAPHKHKQKRHTAKLSKLLALLQKQGFDAVSCVAKMLSKPKAQKLDSALMQLAAMPCHSTKVLWGKVVTRHAADSYEIGTIDGSRAKSAIVTAATLAGY